MARLTLPGAEALDLDDVEPEVRLHDRADLAGEEAEGRVLELPHHPAPPEPAEVATELRRAEVVGVLPGQRREVLARVHPLQQRIGFGPRRVLGRLRRLGAQQDLAERQQLGPLRERTSRLLEALEELVLGDLRGRGVPKVELEVELLDLRHPSLALHELAVLGQREALRRQRLLERRLAAELLSELIDLLRDALVDRRFVDLDERVLGRRLHDEELVHELVEHAAEDLFVLGIRRRRDRGPVERHPLHLLLDLRLHHGRVAHDGDEPIDDVAAGDLRERRRRCEQEAEANEGSALHDGAS